MDTVINAATAAENRPVYDQRVEVLAALEESSDAQKERSLWLPLSSCRKSSYLLQLPFQSTWRKYARSHQNNWMRHSMLDSVPTGVGTDRHLFGRMGQVRTVVIELCKLSVPISGLDTLDMAC